MKTKDAVDYFGGSKTELANALGVDRSAITLWGEDVPRLRQYQIEILTKGALKADRPLGTSAA